MKAIVQSVYGSADVLELRDVERPSIKDDEVLVEVRAAGVDPGVWVLMTGRPYLMRLLGFGLRRPKVAGRGRAVAGVVAAVGARVTRFRPGDEVYGTSESGSFAEFARALEGKLAVKPANLSFPQAAAVPVSGVTALQAVRDVAQVRSGQRVLVIGAAGGVGSYAVQLARSLGAHVTGVCGPDKAALVRSLGAEDVIDYTKSEVDSGGARYDVIIDTAGNRPLSLLRRALAPRGTLALVGGGHVDSPVLGGMDRTLRAGFVSMVGGGQRLRGVMARERASDLDELRQLIEAGSVTPAIDRTFALPAAPDAVRYLAEGHPAGKVVVTIG